MGRFLRENRLVLVALVLFGSLVGYGIIAFPGAPITYRAGRYVDKSGHECSADQYHRFRIWIRVFLTAWAGGAVALGVALWRDRRG